MKRIFTLLSSALLASLSLATTAFGLVILYEVVERRVGSGGPIGKSVVVGPLLIFLGLFLARWAKTLFLAPRRNL